ncbi:MAG: ATP-binding protein [Thermoguttaceae bacterium]|nr:ATP-binding protein [Thermoguttaceae bacterium]
METFKWGKKILATLSTGLYANPFFIYREYVQNAADAIEEAIDKDLITRDAAQILIDVDAKRREITIRDNGVGVERSRVSATLGNIGDSQKNANKHIGHFGIGRMGGLGYCEKLIFETSAFGENTKSIVECDAEKLRDALVDPKVTDDASAIWISIVSTREEPFEANEHFFTVKLVNVYKSHDELLNVNEVQKYLLQVAPVPFSSLFKHRDKLKAFCEENGFKLREYALLLNNDEVFKCYTDPFDDPTTSAKKNIKIDINDVKCGILEENGQRWGWYWYADTDFKGALHKSCLQRGLRLRQWNVQIGESNCLNTHNLWREERGHNYFIGEIHVDPPSQLAPNARRDYFEEDENCRAFEKQLKKLFFELHEIYHLASDLRSCDKAIEESHRAQEEYERKLSQGFYDSTEKEKARLECDIKIAKGRKAEKNRQKLERKFGSDTEIAETPNETPARKTIRNILNRPPKTPSPTRPTIPPIVETSSKQAVVDAPVQPPVSPPQSQYWINTLTDGERKILEIVQKVLKASLKESEADKIWSKITQQITE